MSERHQLSFFELRIQNIKAILPAMFVKATINYLEELAGILGPIEVIFHSQDDKAKVPLGITAAKKQSPMVNAHGIQSFITRS